MKRSYLVITCVLAVTWWAAVAQAGIVTAGFNEDEIFENALSASISQSVDTGYATWAETGFTFNGGTVNPGVPPSLSFVSATGSGVTYTFQPYTQDNALRLGDGNPDSGTLTVVAGQYTRLYILATSGSGGGTSDITLTFSDNTTSTYTDALYAPDWYVGAGGSANVALGGLQREKVSGTSPTGLDNRASFQFYESILNLNESDSGKPLVSITFNNAASGGATSVYDVVGFAVPLPPTALLLGSGLVALGLLRRKWSLKH